MNRKADSDFHTVRGYQMIKQQQNLLSPAMEDYLEMICRLCKQDGYTRVGKLSTRLNVRPSSVSKMLVKLIDLGLLSYNGDNILLTDKGKEVGSYLIERHQTVEDFLKLLGNSNPLEETELIEHSLTLETVAQLDTMITFFQQNAEAKKCFNEFRDKKKRP